MSEVVVGTPEQMRALGVRLAGLLRAGDLVLLVGDLGAGKTTLAAGIGAGLGVRGRVTSPTFVQRGPIPRSVTWRGAASSASDACVPSAAAPRGRSMTTSRRLVARSSASPRPHSTSVTASSTEDSRSRSSSSASPPRR